MKKKTILAAIILFGLLAIGRVGLGQEKKPPLGKEEIIQLLKQATGRRLSQGDIAGEIAQRGLAFPVDERALEELRQAGAHAVLLDEIRRASGKAEPPPPLQTPPLQTNAAEAKASAEEVERAVRAEAEARAEAFAKLPFLEQARHYALDYAEELLDFTVTQMVTRYHRTFSSKDWTLLDTLEIELSYRIKGGEKFKLVKLNGAPTKMTYEDLGGATSTGEFGSMLGALFDPRSQAEFKEVKHEVFRGHQTVVFEFKVQTAHSQSQITDKTSGRTITSGYQGSIWIDTETKRALRIEESQDDIPRGFRITLSENAVEYDWVTISGERYLLPIHAEVLMGQDRERYYTRNVIEFRNYHKFDSDVKITSPGDPIKTP